MTRVDEMEKETLKETAEETRKAIEQIITIKAITEVNEG